MITFLNEANVAAVDLAKKPGIGAAAPAARTGAVDRLRRQPYTNEYACESMYTKLIAAVMYQK